MAELLNTGAVFLHVPKCGGTWVRTVLHQLGVLRGRIGYKHSPVEHVNNIMRFHGWQFVRHWPFHPWVTPGSLRKAYKFCFVRHPLSWYESWWKFTMKTQAVWEQGRWHPQRPIDGCASDDFNVFLRNVLKHRAGYVSEMYSWYTEGSSFVGRFERLEDDLAVALCGAGVEVDVDSLRAVPAVNVSEEQALPLEWDPVLRSRIIESEWAGIERYGYVAQVQRESASSNARLEKVA